MAGKPGWWNANEQVSQAQAWTPVHKLGDYSVKRGGGDGLFGDIAHAIGTVAMLKFGGKGGKAGAGKPLKALPAAKEVIGQTAVMPTTPAARNTAFNFGAQGSQQTAIGPRQGYNLTDVRSASTAGQDVSTWAGGRYRGTDPGLGTGITPARLKPFQAGIGAAEPETAELVSTPLTFPNMLPLNAGPLALNAGPQRRRKAGGAPNMMQRAMKNQSATPPSIVFGGR